MSKQKEVKKYIESSMLFVKLASNKPPIFLEKVNKDWVYFGKDNNYPNYLLSLFNQSAKHNAIVTQKMFYIAGAGYENNKGATIVNTDDETLDDVTKKAILDYEIFGGFALEVIWNKAKSGIEIRHIDFSNVRSDKENEEFYYTKNWQKTDASGYVSNVMNPEDNEDWEVYTPFDEMARKGKQLFYFKSYRPGLDVYPLPEYLGSIAYIELDYQISNYWYNAVKYGFAPSHVLNFYNGVPTHEDQAKLEKEIQKKFTGTDNAGRFILNFSDNKETGGSDIQNISPADLDKQFNILNETVQQEIFSGHRITSPMLFGIQTPGKLGGRTELIEANELFQNIYVNPKQAIIEKAMGLLMRFKGVKEPLKLKKIEPIGIDLLDNTNGWQILTDEEKRQAIGKNPLPKISTATGSEIVNALNTLSPQVATKILSAMTQNEVRAIARLSPMAGGDVVPLPDTGAPTVNTTPPAVLPTPVIPAAPKAKMDTIKMINLFQQLGKKSTGKRLASRFVDEVKFEGLADNEKEYMASVNDQSLKPFLLSILDLLDKDNLMSAEDMAKVLKTDVSKVKNGINTLKERDLLTQENTKSGDTTVTSLSPAQDARKILGETPAPTEQIYVKYSYDWRADVPEDRRDTKEHPSRDFCKQLKAMSDSGVMWSREDIENISNEFGTSVWEDRGGWFTLPGTDIHRPSCRHVWRQVVLHEKV